MSSTQNTIKCPKCDHDIDVNEVMYGQLNDELSKQYENKLAEKTNVLEKQTLALKKEKDDMDSTLMEAIQKERGLLSTSIKEKLEREHQDAMDSINKEIDEKSKQLRDFNKAKIQIEKLTRDNKETEDRVRAEAEKQLTERLAAEREKIIKNESNKMSMKLSEREIVIEQLKESLKIAQQKAEQGSMQIQGEVQELAIEEWLKESFPLDAIDEIKKGAKGADCMHTVNTTTKSNCGKIYYESKRTKYFSANWIEKLKGDMREKNVSVGVIVTSTLPEGVDRLSQMSGVWVCTFEEFKSLSKILRQSVIDVDTALSSQENKGDKMTMLYDFLTGNEFRLQVEAIVEGFTQMKVDLESEKRSLTGIWKKREKQIDKVILNTNFMHNSIKGIAGNAIQSIPLLELPEKEIS